MNTNQKNEQKQFALIVENLTTMFNGDDEYHRTIEIELFTLKPRKNSIPKIVRIEVSATHFFGVEIQKFFDMKKHSICVYASATGMKQGQMRFIFH